MQRLVRFILVLMLPAVLACGDSTGVQPEDLVGVWTSISLVYTSTADTSVSVDLADQGYFDVIGIQSDGALSVTRHSPDGADSDFGTFNVVGNEITITFGGDAVSGTISRNGNTMTLELTEGVEFDFGDDTDQPATFVGRFVRAG